MKRILFAALAALLFCCISTEMRAQVPAPFGKLRVDKSYALRVYDEADVLMTKDQRSVYWNLEEDKACKTAQILEIPAYTCAVAGGALIGWFGANMIMGHGDKTQNLTLVGVGAGVVVLGGVFNVCARHQVKKAVRSYNGRTYEDVTFRLGGTSSGAGLTVRF